jgi:hypothetical protein
MADLIAAGYVLQGMSEEWSGEEVKMFFESCQRYRKVGPELLGKYAGVYEWISTSVLKGGRSTQQVRRFAETVFNAHKKRRRVSTAAFAASEKDGEDGEQEAKNKESDEESDDGEYNDLDLN